MTRDTPYPAAFIGPVGPVHHEEPEHLPMSPRMYATLIMERLREGGITVPLHDKDGYTMQDIITDHIERAIADALQPSREL